MYTKILVPLDGSWMSEKIVPYARFFAHALKIPVELLQVIDPDSMQILRDPASEPLNVVETKLRSVSRTYLERMGGAFSDEINIRCSVEVGKPTEVILARAAVDSGILIAMSTHGHSGVTRWFLGSVAEKVLQASTNHLLLVRKSNQRSDNEIVNLTTVLVPLDGSSLAEKVLIHVASLAQKLNLEVIVLRIYDLPVSSYFVTEDYIPDMRQLSQNLEAETKHYLEMKAQQLLARGVERVSTMAISGKAADTIIDMAWKTPDNLVMMCTHGRSGIGRWVIGSVASRVVRHSNDPVLLIRPAEY